MKICIKQSTYYRQAKKTKHKTQKTKNKKQKFVEMVTDDDELWVNIYYMYFLLYYSS